MTPENYKKALEILKRDKAELSKLFAGSPLQLQTDSVLDRLINGIAHAGGITDSGASQTTEEAKPLTHIAGNKITFPDGKPAKEAATPKAEEVSAVKEQVEEAYDLFSTMKPKDISDMFPEMVIRGVAVRAGMDVTPTNPKNINLAFIGKIKAAVDEKVAADEAAKEAAEAAEKLKAKKAAEAEDDKTPVE